MKFVYPWFLVLLLSCGKEKTVVLPKIAHSEITKIEDISPAYLFYNEKMSDSIELNRKNLISTTNWLFNVDKRLTLKQAIPKIMFLQEKKRNMKMHRNEDAKNYYTCNDTGIKNLGFIEFTNVVYHLERSVDYYNKTSDVLKYPSVNLFFNASGKIKLNGKLKDSLSYSNRNTLKADIKNLTNEEPYKIDLKLNFDKNLIFQDYISFKSLVSELKLDNVTVDNNEFIY